METSDVPTSPHPPRSSFPEVGYMQNEADVTGEASKSPNLGQMDLIEGDDNGDIRIIKKSCDSAMQVCYKVHA